MSRLTKKFEFLNKTGYEFCEGYDSGGTPIMNMNCAIHKLGRLEDLEEELGCPLEVVFKALKKGIIPHNKSHRLVDLSSSSKGWCLTCEEPASFGDWDCEEYRKPTEYYYLKDYKKTWWLKGEKQCH